MRLHLRHQIQSRVAQARSRWSLHRHGSPARHEGDLVQEGPPPAPPLHPHPQLQHPEDRVDESSGCITEGELPDDHQHDTEPPLHAARSPAARAEARASAAELRRVPGWAAGPAPVQEAPQVRGHVRGGEGAARRSGPLAGDRREACEGGREDRTPREVCTAGL